MTDKSQQSPPNGAKRQQGVPTRGVWQEPAGSTRMGVANYGLTEESWPKPPPLYTTICGYVEQTRTMVKTSWNILEGCRRWLMISDMLLGKWMKIETWHQNDVMGPDSWCWTMWMKSRKEVWGINVGLCPHGCKAQVCKHVKQRAANEMRCMTHMCRPWQR